MPRHIVRVPPITRVHNLYRFRFTTNQISFFIKGKQKPTSISFEKELALVKLSKNSRIKLRDRIGRRSRDHLATCTYLNLLNRKLIKNEFHYFPTYLGSLLNNYKFADECPKDLNERSVFITSLMRLKFINGHYEDRTFIKRRFRPVLNILYALNEKPLHLFQLYYILGKSFIDPAWDSSEIENLLDIAAKTEYRGIEGKDKFVKDIKLTAADLAEAGRSIRPLLNWCIQAGLLWNDENYFYHINPIGEKMLSEFLTIRPMWFKDLGKEALRKSVILYLAQFLKETGISISEDFFSDHITFKDDEFFKTPNRELFSELNTTYKLFKNRMNLKFAIDFDLSYDVPPEYQNSCLFGIKDVIKKYSLGVNYKDTSQFIFERIKSLLEDSTEEKELKSFFLYHGFERPRKELFSVEFEYHCCFILRMFGFNADKYQGQLADAVRKALKNYAENNPDILVTNSISYLIECKSKEEWGDNLSFDKRVRGEFINCNDFAKEVKADSAIILVESNMIKSEFFEALKDELKNLDKIIFVSNSYLEKISKHRELLGYFKNIANNPSKYSVEQRILC